VTRLLLDTHIVLWWMTDDPGLSADAKSLIDTEPNIWVSAATVWEIAIKQALGKLPGPANLPELIRDSEFLPLPITASDGIAAARLPAIHRDPFDRILIAQARRENLTLVTRDSTISRYDVPIMLS
jgi:PIN domain nuclease of toxin-antitoxin system